MSRATSVFLLLFLLAALAFALYLLYENLPLGAEQILGIKTQNNGNNFLGEREGINGSDIASYAEGEKMQFYPNMRFARLPILYSIGPECTTQKIGQMQNAISIISERSSIPFIQVSSFENNGISIMCRELDKRETRSRDYYVAGEGGPSEIINTSIFYVITKGEVLLLRESECEDPLVSMHELLHVLGFDHSVNSLSVMYNVSDCRQKLTTDIINEIKRLYSIESLADLYFTNISGTKSGRYLSFNVEIRNRGMADAQGTKLSVYAENEKLNSFDIDAIEIGAGVSLSVENLRLPGRDVKDVQFVIDTENSIRELSEENNAVVLGVE